MQPTLWDVGSYEQDKFIVGNRIPYRRHADHSLAAMRKPFVSWDGEGYSDEWGRHHYWLLSNSLGDRVIAPPGRSIERYNIARLFHSVHTRIPDAIHVGFALGYDFTMALRSNGIETRSAQELRKTNFIKLDGYCWRLMMGKMLTLWPDIPDNDTGKFVLQDTWGFFQRSFIKALDEYFGSDWPNRDIIVEMKQKRSTFDREHDDDVIYYNDIELENHGKLMEELRDRLYTSGMPVSRWYGPGAIANGLLAKWNIKDTIIDLYSKLPNVASASQYAYAGGRFELVKCGHINGRVYQYDINSAYPHALARVPDLVNGEWRHSNDPDIEQLPEFSMVRLRWNTAIDYSSTYGGSPLSDLYPKSIPFPLWRRKPNGTITYPSTGLHGWYWLPEAKAAIAYGNSLPKSFGFSYTIEESHAYYANSDSRPYSSIPVLYHTRKQLKARGNGAHIGIKLGLNSLYGKFAQQVGYDERTQRIPKYHNLAIAGFVTAYCRAMMVEAMQLNPTAVIAFETDGIFSMAPLPLKLGDGLGEWEETVYEDMWYYQSGFRFGISSDGEVLKPATRGIPAKDVTLAAVQEQINNCLSTLEVDQTQFITLQWAYSMNHPDMAGQWKTGKKYLSLMGENLSGKRIHDPDCYMCDIDSDGVRHYRWEAPHVTVPAEGWDGLMNTPHDIMWSDLEGVREDGGEQVVIEP